MENEKNFRTTEWPLAISLISLGFPVIEIDHTEPSRKVFIFEKNQRLHGIIESFWNDTLMVPANKFYSSMRMLKARLQHDE